MTSLLSLIRTFRRDTRGMEVSEYAVVGVLIALSGAAAFLGLSNGIGGWVSTMVNTLSGHF